MPGSKHIYLGLFTSEREAAKARLRLPSPQSALLHTPTRLVSSMHACMHARAQAYDRSLVRLRGSVAATNFALSDYRADLADYHRMQQVRSKTVSQQVVSWTSHVYWQMHVSEACALVQVCTACTPRLTCLVLCCARRGCCRPTARRQRRPWPAGRSSSSGSSTGRRGPLQMQRRGLRALSQVLPSSSEIAEAVQLPITREVSVIGRCRLDATYFGSCCSTVEVCERCRV